MQIDSNPGAGGAQADAELFAAVLELLPDDVRAASRRSILATLEMALTACGLPVPPRLAEALRAR
jgi:hypothetical protein